MHQVPGEESIWPLVEDFSSRSSQLFIKKLSRNDTSWADDGGKHQAGFYIPREVRESGFFPPLYANNSEKPHIFYASCVSLWPQTGETKSSGMRHYSNKGPETHFTVVPSEVFSNLSPASLLVAGRLKQPIGDANYWFIVIDSASDDAEVLETTLDLSADFHFDLLDPAWLTHARGLQFDEAAELIDRLHHAIRTDQLQQFVDSVASLPSSDQIAAEARAAYKEATGEPDLDPFRLEAPGDAIMRISRDIEYGIFKKYELRRRASEAVAALAAEPDLVSAVVRGFPLLDSIFLSASQQRKTRAGRSFENHVGTVLTDGRVAFEEQAVFGGRRPDFVLPSKQVLAKRESRPFLEALILSAKTTIRERWKQVGHERFNCALLLATVDDRVSRSALDDMQKFGIVLVVPESLKNSKETYYRDHSNVISFREFFDTQINALRPHLLTART